MSTPITAPITAPMAVDPVECPHAARSRELIRLASEASSTGLARVVGAGRCREIPLAELAARFDEVELQDVDRDSMVEAQAELSDQLRGHVRLQVGNVLRFNVDFDAEVAGILAAAADPDAAAAALSLLAASARPSLPPPDRRPDLLVSSCLLSQLHLPLMSTVEVGFREAFPGAGEPSDHPTWVRAMFDLSRRCQDRLLEGMEAASGLNGLIYLAASVQVCYFACGEDGLWHTPGSLRMTREASLEALIGDGYQVLHRGSWPWVARMPDPGAANGTLYNVQALVLKVDLAARLAAAMR